MNNNLENKTRAVTGVFASKKSSKKVSLNLHVMPHSQNSSDVRVFSWLIGGLLILISLIIFLMIYV